MEDGDDTNACLTLRVSLFSFLRQICLSMINSLKYESDAQGVIYSKLIIELSSKCTVPPTE